MVISVPWYWAVFRCCVYRSRFAVHKRGLHRLLLEHAIAVSMDGRGAWRDNVFVARLWRSVKYEEVYLRAYDSVGEARASLSCYFKFYNTKPPHSSFDARTPECFYYDHLPQSAAA
jgi:putative transposase